MLFLNYLTLVAAFLNLGLGLLVFVKTRKRPLNWLFLIFTVCIAVWLYSNYHFAVVEPSLFVLKSQYSLGGLVLIVAFPWTWVFIRAQASTLSKVLLSLLGAAIFVLPFVDGLVVSGIAEEAGSYHYIAGPLFEVFGGVLFILICVLVYGIYVAYKHARGVAKEQIRFTLLGISLFAGISISFATILPVFHITPVVAFDAQSSLIWVALTAYAIIAHQLFDIRVIIKRTVVYSGLLLFTLATYSMIIFFFTAVFGGNGAFDTKTLIANLIAATLIAIGFDPIRRYLTRVTDHYLFKGEYEPQAVLAELSQKLSASIDMQEATQSLVSLIRGHLRLTHAAVLTFSVEQSKIVVKSIIHEGYEDVSVLQLPPENLFLQHFVKTPDPIVTDLLHQFCDNREDSDPAVQACHMLLIDLAKIKAGVVLPILVDKKVIGMFLVGDKLSGDPFSRNDVEFLKIVASQTANAIEKARFWEEDQLKSEFVSIASHELLTPTAAIKGYLSMILEDDMGKVDDTARNYLTKVFNSADRLAHLVEDLLNVSRIEGGRLKVNKKEFSLVESAQRAVDELQVNAKKKSLDLAFVAPTESISTVFADPDHVYRVLVNLVGNAIKYTPQGWVRCFVTMYKADHVLFAVSDSGLGIPAESIPHLFEKFYRADRKEIAGIQGTGLGLYISKKIIEMMGGQLWVQSEVGKGSTFFFTVPTATAGSQPVTASNSPAQPTQSTAVSPSTAVAATTAQTQ